MRLLVSVCVVTFNHEKYIRDCIMSVLMQRFDGDLEIIVGQDGSTDATSKILADLKSEFPDRLLVIDRESNIGPFNNLRDIIAKARGDFIAHLDGDDFWMPGKLQAQLDFFASHKDCVAVYSNAQVIDSVGALKGGFNNPQPAIIDMSYLARGGNFLNHSSLIYRRDARGVFTDLLGSYIDFRVHLRLSALGPLGYVNRDLVAYRMGTSTSMMANQSARVHALYWEALADPALDNLPVEARREAIAVGIAQSWIASVVGGRPLNAKLSDARNLGAAKGLGIAGIIATAFGIFLRRITSGLRTRIAVLLDRDALIVFYKR